MKEIIIEKLYKIVKVPYEFLFKNASPWEVSISDFINLPDIFILFFSWIMRIGTLVLFGSFIFAFNFITSVISLKGLKIFEIKYKKKIRE